MSLEDFLDQDADIFVEATIGGAPPQDALGGADRTTFLPVASGVPCLVSEKTAALMAFSGGARDDARRNVKTARIYFVEAPAPEGLSSRHRIVVSKDGRTLGTYAVTGSIDPNTMGHHVQVDCERIVGDPNLANHATAIPGGLGFTPGGQGGGAINS